MRGGPWRSPLLGGQYRKVRLCTQKEEDTPVEVEAPERDHGEHLDLAELHRRPSRYMIDHASLLFRCWTLSRRCVGWGSWCRHIRSRRVVIGRSTAQMGTNNRCGLRASVNKCEESVVVILPCSRTRYCDWQALSPSPRHVTPDVSGAPDPNPSM